MSESSSHSPLVSAKHQQSNTRNPTFNQNELDFTPKRSPPPPPKLSKPDSARVRHRFGPKSA
ncbi:hypothetical protein K7432_012137, partial [Basidiobolus ranarum]